MRRLLLFTLFACAASAQTDSQSGKIVPAYSVAPSVFQIGQTPNVLLSLTNQNPSAVEQLQPGDVFTFTLGVPGAAFSGAAASAVVNSSSFLQSDFSIWMGPGPNQVQITYLGPTVPFPADDTIAVKTTVISSQVGAGTLSLQTPPERYVVAQSPSLNISAVDFPVAPPDPPGLAGPFGPQGPAGPAGFPGQIGSIGPQGPAGIGFTGPGGSQGPQGVPGAPGATGLTFRNAWNVATSYPVGDAVSYNGSSYISLSGSNAGNTPSNGARWALLAQQGATGATGIGTAEDLSHASSAR
jgi:Collagen triple helix repeat (20 copies)